jgi:hypothetical protein
MTFPSGTVTFLFTGVEGSTKLTQEYPDDMPARLTRHDEILNQAIQRQNGDVFQWDISQFVADSFSATFHSASDAMNHTEVFENFYDDLNPVFNANIISRFTVASKHRAFSQRVPCI